MSIENKSKFEEAGARKQASLLRELFAMVKQNKKYWLVPIVIVLILLGIFLTFGSSSAAPFIYTLF
jgi:hypothetical protein